MLHTFYFNDNAIDFDLSPDHKLMVDATAMAKIFGRRTENFLNTENTKKFIEIMESRYCLNSNDIFRTSTNGGTWMHRKLALKFAAWLSPEFENWVYDTIEKLMFAKFDRATEINEERRKLKKSIADKELRYYNEIPDFADYIKDKARLALLAQQMGRCMQPEEPEFDFSGNN